MNVASDRERGLWIFRSSRLEGLLDPLATLLAAAPPAGLLEPAELVTAHPGMRRWLLNQLAIAAGPRGIAANLRIDLPGQWLERSCDERLGQAPAPGWQRGALRWRLHEALRAVESGQLSLPRLAAYLATDDGGRRRLQLAEALADVYGRLLVYRPDWLRAWEAGRDALPEPTELAPLWRMLRAGLAQPHRGELQERLLQALAAPQPARAPLHVFGLSHLPPRLLDVLAAESRQRVVAMYLPDPCSEHWAGLGHRSARLQALLQGAAEPAALAPLYLGIGHPLLAALGRIGQDFGALIAGHEQDVPVDLRDWRDEQAVADRNHLLGRLQDSVRRLAPERVRAEAPAAGADASLRVHRCHSRLRELEVLRDALRHAFAADPSLRPADVAVLAPDMAAYAPLLGGVFGEPGRADAELPYHVADLPQARTHPLFSGFLALLDSPRQRLSPKSLAALLDVPALGRALGIDDAARADIERWLQEAAIGWGLDAQSRLDEDLPALDSHHFAWGMDRLVGGYLLGDEAADVLVDGIAAAGAVRDTQAATLGALDRLLLELAAIRAQARRSQPLSAWLDLARGLLERCFRGGREDPGQQAAIDDLRSLLGSLLGELDAAGCDPVLGHAQFCDCLRDALAAVPERTPFLHGGISFCGMVPQRALPFRFIAVIGLDEGAFPRQPLPLQLDPLPRHPRLGDREVAGDDRYLFLETLMAARDALHLSWIGEGARDGRPRNPAAPLALLLEWLDQAHGLATDAADEARPWLCRHRLQPALPPAPPPTPQASAADAAPAQARIAATALCQWLRDPARELLRERLRVRLDALDAQVLAEQEPLDPSVDPRTALWRQLLLDALRAGARSVPAAPPALLQARGLLPPGRSGLLAYAGERERAQALLDATRPLAAFADGLPVRIAVPVDARIGEHAVGGTLDGLFEGVDGLWLLDWAKTAKHAQRLDLRLDLLLRWALLRLSDPLWQRRIRPVRVTPDGLDPWSRQLDALDATLHARTDAAPLAALAAWLAPLVTAYLRATTTPALWLPRSSAAAAAGEDVATAWLGTRKQAGERDFAPGYAALALGERRFWEAEDPDHALFAATARAFADRVDLAALATALGVAA